MIPLFGKRLLLRMKGKSMAKSVLTRREKEKLKNKEEILLVALHLFYQKGYHNVSMQDISEKAEFGIGTIYRFFKSKEALFEEMLNNIGDRILNDFLQILEGPGNPIQRISRFIRCQAKFQEQYGEAIKVYLLVIGGNPLPQKYKKYAKIDEKIQAAIVSLIQEGIKDGLFHPVDPDVAARIMMSATEAITFEMAGDINEAQAAETFQKVEQFFFGGLVKPGVRNNE